MRNSTEFSNQVILQQNFWTNQQQMSGYSVTTSQLLAEWPTPSQCQDRNTSSEPSTISKHSKSQRSQHKSTWVPGHVNVKGNERVDQLAKEGTKLPKQECDSRVSITFLKRKMREEDMETW